jgi:hypothetical protein
MEDNEGVDAAEEVGVDGSDILPHAVEDDIRGRFRYFSSQTEMRRTRWGCVKKCRTHDSDKSFHDVQRTFGGHAVNSAQHLGVLGLILLLAFMEVQVG